ncbi:MAG: DUF2220 family protein [Victivallaceae bacterium]|nr:DUF2220 family protein [Victivallaceae bacterium]
MKSKNEQYLAGQQRTFKRNPQLKSTAILVLKRLATNPDAKSITLPNDSLGEYNDLFLNCAKRRGERIVLDISAMKTVLSSSFVAWTEALKTTSDFVPEKKENIQEAVLSLLRFQIPGIDWQQFTAELKRESMASLPTLQNAWKIAEYLQNLTETIAPAELGAKLFHDSKYLKNCSVQTWACRFLRQKNAWCEELSDQEILQKFGLTNNPTASTVMVYGAFVYQSVDTTMTWIRDLWSKKQSAILSGDNLADFSKLQIDTPVITVENETVFNTMKQSNPEFALVYTAGFPGRAVRKFVGMLPENVQLFHWGDSDPEGYEIAAILDNIHRLKLFRCNATELEQQKNHCIPLSPAKQKRAKRLLQNPEFPFTQEIGWILQNMLWLEQESYREKELEVVKWGEQHRHSCLCTLS